MIKTFILGVGAQRTGSTWLRGQLHQNKNVKMGICKEHHVFDVLFTPYFPEYKDKLFQKIEEAGRRGQIAKKEQDLLSFLENPDNYFDHFDRLYSADENLAAVGDMTPSYSMLDAEAYQFILSGLAKRNFTVKVIFIMRDPVERIWSMIHQKAKVKRAIKSFSFSKFRAPDIA